MASAVAITALDVIIEEKLIERCQALSKKLDERFATFKFLYFDRVQGQGLFRSVYIHQTHPLGRVTGGRLAALFLQRGLLTNSYGSRIRLAPALVIEESVLLKGIDMIEQALNDIADIDRKMEGE